MAIQQKILLHFLAVANGIFLNMCLLIYFQFLNWAEPDKVPSSTSLLSFQRTWAYFFGTYAIGTTMFYRPSPTIFTDIWKLVIWEFSKNSRKTSINWLNMSEFPFFCLLPFANCYDHCLLFMFIYIAYWIFRFPDKSKVCLKFHFLDILRRVMEASRWNAHLRNTCRRLRIVHVSPEIAQVCT